MADRVPATLAELVFGVTHEGAVDVDDLLDRRTRIGLVAADRERAVAAAQPGARAGARRRVRDRKSTTTDEFSQSTPVGTRWQTDQSPRSQPMRTATVTTETSTSHTGELHDFDALTQRYQRELLAHCYRMSGSVHEAEDLVQETLLRAWKASADFQGRSSVRTWLYRIATNVCLTNLEGRPRRPLPTGLGATDVRRPPTRSTRSPRSRGSSRSPTPPSRSRRRTRIRLAFVAALQHLPARQRAVLILRDVLRWSAAEVAEALDTTVRGGQLRAPAGPRPDRQAAARRRPPSPRR